MITSYRGSNNIKRLKKFEKSGFDIFDKLIERHFDIL